MRLARSLAALAAALLAAGCTIAGEWRRANRHADWMLTQLAALGTRNRLAGDKTDDLERARTDLERRIRVVQDEGRSANRDDDAAGVRSAIDQLDALDLQVEKLREEWNREGSGS